MLSTPGLQGLLALGKPARMPYQLRFFHLQAFGYDTYKGLHANFALYTYVARTEFSLCPGICQNERFI